MIIQGQVTATYNYKKNECNGRSQARTALFAPQIPLLTDKYCNTIESINLGEDGRPSSRRDRGNRAGERRSRVAGRFE